MPLINDSFMLHSETAKHLFHDYAKPLPIIDYHCHLSPKMIADDHRFRNATDLFLGGDHYKWRQMRSHGVDERFMTGDASDEEKFAKWAETLPLLIGNPLLHWNALELAEYFDTYDMLTPKNCKEIYEKVNSFLARPDYSARGLISRSNVTALCTTDDPLDDLRYHKAIAALPKEEFSTKVLPTFRPDKCVEIGKEPFRDYIEQTGVSSYKELLDFLEKRVNYFYENGCLVSDHGLDYVPYAEGDAEKIFDKKMTGKAITHEEEEAYKTAVLRHCAKLYAAKGMAMQLHMGAIRNNNTRIYKALGPDVGCDSVADYSAAYTTSRFLDSLEREECLPKTILYNLNPCDNYVLATMLGNFQAPPYKSKIQFGSGWWFNDQRDGMEAQMKALANLGMIAHFVGMLTDSRSFVSYPRHEYFRRIFCNLIGEWVEKGEYPADEEYLKQIVEGVCYYNAKEYFGF